MTSLLIRGSESTITPIRGGHRTQSEIKQRTRPAPTQFLTDCRCPSITAPLSIHVQAHSTVWPLCSAGNTQYSSTDSMCSRFFVPLTGTAVCVMVRQVLVVLITEQAFVLAHTGQSFFVVRYDAHAVHVPAWKQTRPRDSVSRLMDRGCRFVHRHAFLRVQREIMCAGVLMVWVGDQPLRTKPTSCPGMRTRFTTSCSTLFDQSTK